MITVISSIFFVFGVVIGSFLNVVIYRYNTQRSFGGRSACMTCKKQLAWYELVPVLSFLLQWGRCRGCQSKFSIQYPVVELSTGLVFLGIFIKLQDVFFLDFLSFSMTYAYYAVLFSLLLIIAVYDLRHKIIPDLLALVFGVLSFAGIFVFNEFGFNPHVPGLWELLSGLVVALPFALVWLLSRGAWMGLGDAKLAIGLGYLLGLSRALSGIVVAFWLGAGVGIALILFSKNHGMKSEVPFAPFLVLGAIIAFVFELHLLTGF